MAKKTVTKKQAKASASTKPSVKYDDWMMERLKKNRKEAFEYLKTSLEENADFPPAFLLSLRRVSEAYEMSLEDIAKESGISTAAIYKALGEKGNPTIDTLASILKTMGFKLTLTPIDKAS
jgi:probable addiction module antidote protein